MWTSVDKGSRWTGTIKFATETTWTLSHMCSWLVTLFVFWSPWQDVDLLDERIMKRDDKHPWWGGWNRFFMEMGRECMHGMEGSHEECMLLAVQFMRNHNFRPFSRYVGCGFFFSSVWAWRLGIPHLTDPWSIRVWGLMVGSDVAVYQLCFVVLSCCVLVPFWWALNGRWRKI